MNQSEQLPSIQKTEEDPLLQCLFYLGQYFRRPCSKAAITAGLPLQQGKLTTELLPRAAEQAGMLCTLQQIPLVQLQQLQLPLLLLLQNDQPALLLQTDNTSAELYFPDEAVSRQRLTWQEIGSRYSGWLYTITPQYSYFSGVDRLSIIEPGHWFWGTLRKLWPIYSDIVISAVLINLFALALPLFIMNVYDRVVPNNAVETLWVLGIGVMVVVGFDFLLRTLRSYFIDIAGKQADKELASRLFAQVMAMRTAFMPKSAGAFASNLRDFESIRDFLTSATIAAVVDLPFSLFFIAIIALLGGEVALVPLLLLPLMLLFGLLLQPFIRKAIMATFEQGARKQATVIESIMAMEDIKLLRAEGVFQRRWEQLVDQMAESHLQTRIYSSVVTHLFLFLQQLATVGVVIWGVYLIREGEMTMGALFACTILTGRAMAPLGQVSALMTRFHYAKNALHALNGIMSAPIERPLQQQFIQCRNFHGTISIDAVSFQYQPQQQPVLQNISLRISAGERIAILGKIGSGKSTLAKLLLALYAPTEGQIQINNTNLSQWDPADLRHFVGYVPQKAALFAGTIRENLTLGAPDISDEQMMQHAIACGVDSWIQALPNGYQYQLGEQGMGLSDGQKQMLVISRALMHQPQLLILDEPTSALDGNSELQIRQMLQQVTADKTVIIITHRAAMLSLVDRLIVLDNGAIIADGPKAAVLQQLAAGGSANNAGTVA